MSRKNVSVIAALVFILCWPLELLAEPRIHGVTGVVSEGERISIAGSGFGTVGPTVLLFDDFEKGLNGAQIATAPGTAAVGNWDYTQLTVRYSTSYSHSGRKSLHSDWGSDGAAEGGRLVRKVLDAATELYFSWWQYLPEGANVPGGGGPHGPNWKFFWLYGPRFPQSDYTSVLITNDLPPGYADYVGFGALNDNHPPQRYGAGWIYPVEFKRGIWKRFDQYLKWGTEGNGIYGLWELKKSGYHQWAYKENVRTGHEGEVWEYLQFPGYGRGDSINSHTYYDDIYIAKGLGARARVELGNKSSYSKCTNLAIITPTSWTDVHINAVVRQGSFVAGSKAYLFVIDSGGRISSGYPCSIGARHGK